MPTAFWRLLLVLALGLRTLTAAAQVPAVFADYDYLPVSGTLLGRFSVGPYQATLPFVGPTKGSSQTSLGLGGVLASTKSHARQQQRLTVEDGRSGQRARVQALAELDQRASLLENLSTLGRPGRDSLTGHRLDAYAGTIQLGEQPTADDWQFTVQNANQVGGARLHGTLSGGIGQRIAFGETNNVVATAEASGVPAALLAAQVPYGIIFSLDGQPIAALDLGSTSNWAGRPKQALWLKKGLDPTLQLVVASLATALATRPNLK